MNKSKWNNKLLKIVYESYKYDSLYNEDNYYKAELIKIIQEILEEGEK